MADMHLSEWIKTWQSRFDSDSSEYDARLLAEAVTGLNATRQRIYDPILASDELTLLNQFAQRRCKGEPIAYILGHQPFYTLELLVDKHTLIPRGDSECIVEAALRLLPSDATATIADLGTGSGALAIAIASERPKIKVIATDRSIDALLIATQNCQRHHMTNLSFLCADWLQPFARHSLNLILSNPPYIAEDDPHLLALGYEPHSALVANEQGFAALKHLISQGAMYLKPQGWLLLEHGYQQGASLRSFASQFVHWRNILTIKDYGNNERVTQMQYVPPLADIHRLK